MSKLSKFQVFWLGLNTARKDSGLPEILFGEARVLFAIASESI